MGNNVNRFIVNLGLFVFGISSAFSGMLVQVKYHMGNHGNIAIEDFVPGINYHDWSAVHKISIVVLSLLMIYHIYQHWKWYKVVITKRLFAKNQQVLIFSLLFVLVAITGLTPWFIDLFKGDEIKRKTFIEIHDKFAIILTIYIILHIIKRMKWFFTSFDKIKNKHSTQPRSLKKCRGSRLFKDCSPLQLTNNQTENRPLSATFHTTTVCAVNRIQQLN